ncbi:hypothetical protein B296_00020646 [Ensete ventricosum]|uniref:Uncharacterized protein n=1 Tax=Ensete ventricosum TaxID=4639 RepID=A0A427AG55_ENSVE|nr:hypothetical protein B296_00020646 [Ensete ventricosum]
MRALCTQPIEALPMWLSLQVRDLLQMFRCPHPPLVQSRGANPFCSDVLGSMVHHSANTTPWPNVHEARLLLISSEARIVVEGVVGLGMASQGATLVLRTSWFNRSSLIRAKEIVAIKVYDVDAEDDNRLIDLRLGGRQWKQRQKQLWELLGKVEVAEMAIGQLEYGFDTR